MLEPTLSRSVPLTGLEARLEHVWRDCHSPVEDPCKASSNQDPRHTEVTDAAEHNPSQTKPWHGVQTSPCTALGKGVTERASAGRRRLKGHDLAAATLLEGVP